MTKAQVIKEEKAAEEAFQEEEASRAEEKASEPKPKSELELLKEEVAALRVRVNELSATDGLGAI